LFTLLIFFNLYFINAFKIQNETEFNSSNKPRVLGAFTENPRNSLLTEFPPIKKTPYNGALEEKVLGKSYLVVDLKTHEILLERSSNLKLPIASITKLLTAITAYAYLDPMQDYPMPEINEKYRVKPALNLLKGQRIKMIDLLRSALVCSANDAAESLSQITELITQRDFIILMNEKAKSIGMLSSNFSNPTGFDSENNFSTAQDLLKLADYSLNISAIKQLGKLKRVDFNSMEGEQYFCKTSNKLLWENSEFENLKTGWTEKSNGSMIVKAKNDLNEILIILLNSTDREADVKLLADLAFQQFHWNLEK
jgi:D-alanyl-D-alanine carboxypeptidase (penicillin-binding protein 5/6)